MNYHSMRMHSAGALGYNAYKWLKVRVPLDYCGCDKFKTLVGESAPLGYGNVLLPFLFFTIGVAMSLFALAVELFKDQFTLK